MIWSWDNELSLLHVQVSLYLSHVASVEDIYLIVILSRQNPALCHFQKQLKTLAYWKILGVDHFPETKTALCQPLNKACWLIKVQPVLLT
jgi:hypothetical protein